MPETDEPQAPKEVGSDPIPAQATEISNDEYHELSEDYLNAVYEKAEALAESREDVEVDYSVSLSLAPH
jgi:frataxin